MTLIKRLMGFVDGENLVVRYQQMLKEGETPHGGVIHKSDVYVWHPSLVRDTVADVRRVTFYTSAVGDEDFRRAAADEIQRITYSFLDGRVGSSGRLDARVYRRTKGTQRSKGVDIALTTDVLIHVHGHHVDTVDLFTGDGDYLPLVEEVKRSGKQVRIFAFSSGLNRRLAREADHFVSLDETFFERSRR